MADDRFLIGQPIAEPSLARSSAERTATTKNGRGLNYGRDVRIRNVFDRRRRGIERRTNVARKCRRIGNDIITRRPINFFFLVRLFGVGHTWSSPFTRSTTSFTMHTSSGPRTALDRVQSLLLFLFPVFLQTPDSITVRI